MLQHKKTKQWELILNVLSHVQLKTKPLLLGILITFGAIMWPAPASLLMAVKQKAYIALLIPNLSFIIPLLERMSSCRFPKRCFILRYEIFGALLFKTPDSPCSICLKVIYSWTSTERVGSPLKVETSYFPLLPTSSKAFLNFKTMPILIEAAECLSEHLTLS